VWVGPLPDPDALERFGQIVPNGAERIVRMAETEQLHRMALERSESEIHKRTLEEGIVNATREQRMARLGVWLGWSLSVVSVYLDAHWSVSVALVGVPLMSVVRAFILGK
jgi:uncharacterized membrane protein